ADRIVIMKDGLVQQVGSPKDVYNNPVNTFVATFIGSPSMTLLPCELTEKSGKLHVTGQGFSLPVPDRLKASANKHPDKQITVGLRPEHFAAEARSSDFAPVELTVKVSEYIGSSQYLAASLGGQDVTAAVEVGPESDLLSDGQYFFDTSRLYLFDNGSGEALTE
ncbi:MAG: sugar ABC transporter ATP-binding protein, partial [Pseudomonadota bacterium]